jgi:hypothetical protein
MEEMSATERKQDKAIVALLAEPTVETAADAAEVGVTTIYRWLKEPQFVAQLRAARRAVVEGAIGRLQAAATEAVDTLRRNLTSGNPSVEVRAATTIIEQATKAIALFDLDERVSQLEARLGDALSEAER